MSYPYPKYNDEANSEAHIRAFLTVQFYFDFYNEPLYATNQMYEGTSLMTKTIGTFIIVVTLTMVKEDNCMDRIRDTSNDSRFS